MSNIGDNEFKKKTLDNSEKSECRLLSNIEEESELDILIIEIHNLVVSDLEQCEYMINVEFQDKAIIETYIKAIGNSELADDSMVAIKAKMSYDPFDYESMCKMIDFPLIVTIQPTCNTIQYNTNTNNTTCKDKEENLSSSSATLNRKISQPSARWKISSCVIDILPVLIYEQKLWVRKRMEPTITPPVLDAKSWDNLPVLSLKVYVDRSSYNSLHHDILKKANFMTITVLAAYNVMIDDDEESTYSVGTQMPIHNNENFHIVKYSNGAKTSEYFDSLNTYTNWESLRFENNVFAIGDEKLVHDFDDIINETKINIKHYMKNGKSNVLVWNSFHRGLLLGDSDQYLKDYIRRYKWPFELTITTPSKTLSFMAHLDLSHLLYPGEKVALLALPLDWYDADEMLTRCGLQAVLTPLDSMAPPEIGLKKVQAEGSSQSIAANSSVSYAILPTGVDGNCAWMLVQVKLSKPLKQVSVPRHISQFEINQMLRTIEENEPDRRICTGRGHGREWQNTVRSAAEALLRVAYYNVADFCAFNRQLSTTRTRVEILTSLWQDAALYVNDDFLVNDFIDHEDAYKEMLVLAHIGLMREAEAVLIDPAPKGLNSKLRAARHARQLQDTKHATDLYLEYVSQNPNCGDGWRELGTCLKDVDKDYALVCLLRSLQLNIRHPLTLLSTGTLVFEEDPRAAERFFSAILELYPLWTIGCVTASVYYHKMESFDTAQQIMEFAKKNLQLETCWNIDSSRNWESELGDWFDHMPLMPGMNLYHNAADLLLRFRAITLAEVCIALALNEGLETAAYYHQAALCCRLRQQISKALCFIRTGLEKLGEISCLRSLEVECLLKLKHREAAADSAERVGSSINPFITLIFASCLDSLKARSILSDLVQRQPNAYVWMAIADDWMQRSRTATAADTSDGKMAESYAAACAKQALKTDRRAAKAWALLARLVRPKAKRQYCRKMAEAVSNLIYEATYQYFSISRYVILRNRPWLCQRSLK